MKIDLSGLKNDDKVFSINDGHAKVTSIINDIIYTNRCETYYKNGKLDCDDHHPSLFNSIEECIEYFQSVKKEMDEANKPKKRYWIWSMKSSLGYYYKSPNYHDDNGKNTIGAATIGWNDIEKIKHENEFIDV